MNTRITAIGSALLIGLLAACPIVLTGLIAWRQFHPDGRAAAATGEHVRDWQALGRVGTSLGTGSGAITVVEFSDFQCPYCARVEPTLRELERAYPSRLRVVYRHLPLTMLHAYAFAAAEAAECAGEQGAFASYHDVLLAHQDSIGKRSWSDFAKEAGVGDARAFGECVTQHRYHDRIERDLQTASTLGIHSTPTLIVNGEVFHGNVPIETLVDGIRRSEGGGHHWYDVFGG